MSSNVFINSVFSDEFGEIVHSEEIRVIPARSDESGSTTGIGEFIVSLEHQRGSEDRLLSVGNFSFD